MKKPRELREELGRKAIEAVYAGFNKAGRERITPRINQLMEEYGVQIDAKVDISVRALNVDLAGKDFAWRETKIESQDSSGKTDIREVTQEVLYLMHEEFDRIGREEIATTINALMDEYGRGIDLHVNTNLNVSVRRIEPYQWRNIRPVNVRHREPGDE